MNGIYEHHVRPIFGIAFNTYREAVRSKILYSILFFGLFIITFSAALGQFSLNQNVRVIRDVGLFTLSVFGSLMATFLGVSFVFKEIERKSIYNILSKPIPRWHYFIGKFAGIVGTLYVQLLLMFGLLLVVMLIFAPALSINIVIAFVLICVEVTVVTAVAVLFSSFSTPYLSGFLTLGAYVIGKAGHLLLPFAEGKSTLVRVLLQAIDRIVPALHVFNVSTQVTYDLPIPGAFVYHAVCYGLGYSLVILLIGMFIFSQRDFV